MGEATRALLLALLISMVPAGCSGSIAPADAMRLTTQSGALSAEMRTSPAPPVRGTITVELDVTEVVGGMPRDGLVIGVVPWMPAHGHGTSLVPVVTALGQGKYRVTQVDLFMPGHWELQVTISGPVQDYVVFAFDIA